MRARLLRSVRTLLADPAHWTQGALSRDHHGWPISLHLANTREASAVAQDPAAASWCLVGAIYHEWPGLAAEQHRHPAKLRQVMTLLRTIEARHGVGEVEFNNQVSHAELIATLAAAISEYELAPEADTPVPGWISGLSTALG